MASRKLPRTGEFLSRAQERDIARILDAFAHELLKVFRAAVQQSLQAEDEREAPDEQAEGAADMTLAEIGRKAAHAAQRKALLAELKRQQWNLTATARSLGLANTSNVIRSIRSLELNEEYEAARAAGKIPKGPRG